jgi:hypothetical protein
MPEYLSGLFGHQICRQEPFKKSINFRKLSVQGIFCTQKVKFIFDTFALSFYLLLLVLSNDGFNVIFISKLHIYTLPVTDKILQSPELNSLLQVKSGNQTCLGIAIGCINLYR